MRKKERQLITIGLVVLFAAIAWWAYGHQSGGGWFDLSGWLNDENNTTTDNATTYQLAVSGLAATVDQQTGHVTVSFSLTNEEHFNISSVQVLYALNVADPNNASYTTLTATETNSTWSAEIPASFGDVVYYKVEVTYDTDKILVSDVQSITVTDTTAPTLNSVSINYNSTAGVFDLTFNATDNDAIATYYVYYLDLGTNNTLPANATFSVVNSTTPELNISNITDGHYYALYFVVEDLSNNKAMLYNETDPYIILTNSTATWPVEITEQASS
ncbi:hypothetical protein APY94_04010 [Thermococcus celericrescens]|uniref:Uncharacterized protein n=1 Tax=Thermococcus celericrescens TaxID=227598 RepID=A0A100XYG3_9EURY|nr:hypothetical protein [Thermococcus celericrescens]KUH33903.1 hypothetical protein APY94_04010 [Thermococcus celericrescens]